MNYFFALEHKEYWSNIYNFSPGNTSSYLSDQETIVVTDQKVY